MKQKHRKKRVYESHKTTAMAGLEARPPRMQLLTGASLLAASLLPGLAHAACVSAAGPTDARVSDTQTCYVWTAENFEVTHSGTIAGGDIGVQASVSGFDGTLENFGTIVGTLAGIQNEGNLSEISNSGFIAATGTGVNVAGILNTPTGDITSIVNTNGNSITGDRAGVFNQGKITLVSNLGMISSSSNTLGGTVAGVWNDGGTIGNLVNSGTLRGATRSGQQNGFGVVTQNGGVIDALDNSGTSTGLGGVLVQGNGVLGALTNTGTISGGAGGIFLEGGTIGTIDNRGLIASIPVPTIGVTPTSDLYNGIFAMNGSSVGPVSNTGTITGPGAINVDATSSIGAIANSGLIAGDITSASTGDLVIAGGSGNTVGTLTGTSGGVGVADKGFIKVSAANLVFSGGNLLLNDDINVVGHAVINNGATLQMPNPVQIKGNYTQAGGGLQFTAASQSDYSYLDVRGAAAISNATISLKGADLAYGQTYDVVRSTDGATYSNNTAFVSSNNGLLAKLANVNGNLVVVLAPDAQHHYWDGANTTADGAIAGGSGTWTATGANWTSTDGASNGKLDDADVRPVFGGAAGTVTVDNGQGPINVSGMQFSTDGYRVTGGAIGLAAAASNIEVDDNATATIDSVLAGPGGLAKTGNGMLILNGVNTYAGGTAVNGGTLEIGDASHPGASILGDVAVAAAGTLRGHGTVLGNVTNDGIVRPGGSIGTLTITGDYTQSPGGTLFVDVSPTSASQLKVGGNATLGGTLNVLYGPGTYSAASYRIVDAASVSGRFSSVTSNAPAELAQSVQNLADGSTLTLAAPAGGDSTDTPVDPGAGADPGPGVVVIAPTNATIFGAIASAAIREGQRVNDTLLSRLGQACADAASAADCARPGQQAWAQVVSNTVHVRGNSDASSYKDSHYGFLAGLDRQVGAWTVGVAGGYSHVDVSEDEASGKIDSLRVAGYGSRRVGPVDIAATVGAAYDFLQSRRSFAGVGTARGDTDGQEITAGLQASLPLAAGPVTVTPRVGLRYQYFHADGFNETGSTSQNLDVDGESFNSLQPYAQLAFGIPFSTSASKPALVEARVSYAYETLDTQRAFNVTSGDGTRFTLPGVAPSRGMLSAGLGLTLPIGKALDLTASYDRLFSTGNVSAQTFQLQASYRF
ncbi:autotransporter outer membrane beta-barrel domain-containing protein [Bordetella genomosp. 9]|uniref:Autotransporter domain-containing protein n=1 Tax=Bordetella genomosp. 9 TaxID=1416803 RepID=A0A1W6YWK8_9BORD|nr:autotransporter domain-containing protein [Bordetella genomosp. 9]ARP85289.1 hypothetical protein CAL13_02955 [Bordetella genomosp. 9]